MRILLKQNNLKSRFIANVAGMQPLNEGPKISRILRLWNIFHFAEPKNII